ncbi:hypothetical protein L1987_63899 [Smallanthus sonchifolius]|uniref:Uncharacterized protein n=1 Tax=Smallanthus sonchifolius TaxID=185202 RepID=A0ACB9CEG9_9ASTR|nr:hypothetical protein L1987_63899 [Smallanthus sonchifolius]
MTCFFWRHSYGRRTKKSSVDIESQIDSSTSSSPIGASVTKWVIEYEKLLVMHLNLIILMCWLLCITAMSY